MSSESIAATEKSILGVVDFDEPFHLKANQCSISLAPDSTLKRGVFVKIGTEPYYIAQIVDGPYYAEAKGSTDLHPLIKAWYGAELWALVEKGVYKTVLTRPTPGTTVEPIDIGEVQRLLRISGGLCLGTLASDRRVSIKLEPSSLARHIGVFGTTGSGKSNTIQVLMEEACSQGLSVLVFDVEGEYVEMDKPADRLVGLIKTFGLTPRGVRGLKVYVPYPSTSSRGDAVRFGVKFHNVEVNIFSEAAGLNRMEQLYFQDLVEKVKAVTPTFKHVTLEAVINRLQKRLNAQAERITMPPFIAEAHTTLYSKLDLISKLRIIDVKAPIIKIENVFQPNRVSVIDFSDATDAVRNIVIADLLHKAFKYKMKHPKTPKLLIVIEEAHNFISREKRERMFATLLLVVEIARRGRKRGLYLGIVTQQPNHLPPELLELCNTRIMHRMSSPANIHALKESTGKVPEGMWNTVPSLSVGESIISTPKYLKALSTTIRPTTSKRMVSE